MTTVAITNWLDDVMPQVPGCIEPVALNEIFRSIIDFLERSEAWRQELAPIAVISGVQTYSMASLIPAGTIITTIAFASFDGKPIGPTSPRALDSENQYWRTERGTPRKYYSDEEVQNIILYPIPALTYGLLVPTVALRPDEVQPAGLGAVAVDVALWRWYRETIKHGALHRLLEMPKKPWTNPGLAGMYRQRFIDGAAEALLKAEAAWARGPIHTRTVSRIER